VVVAAAPGRSELALWVDEVLAVRALPANRIQEAPIRCVACPRRCTWGLRPAGAGGPPVVMACCSLEPAGAVG